jgi:hypothetical protein
MRGVIYIVLLAAAIIFVCLYLQRIHTVPT